MSDIHSIYAKTYNFVYLRAKSVLKKEDDIQQLMKEVYLKAAKSTSLREENMYEWLGKRTYVLGCQKYRKKKVREVDLIELSDEEYKISESVDKDRTMGVILDALEQLPDMYQSTLFALYYDHMKLKDIATVMGYSVGAIINRINYTHKYLKKALQVSQENISTKVQFSVTVVKEALELWARKQSLTKMATQNLYSNLCKELGVEMQETFGEEENAGRDKRVVACGSDGVHVVFKELGAYRTKPFLDKQRMRVLVIAAGVVILLILLGMLIFGGSSDDEQSDSQIVVDTEENASDEEVDVETNTDKNTDNESDGQTGEEEELDEDVSEYLIPNSDTVKLTRADLAGFSAEELRIARNEIFARYGTIFGADDLKEYFSGKSWYNPRISFDEFYETIEMNVVEEANISLILEMEEELSE